MDTRHPHVLVLCTGNAARSVIVGELLARRGGPEVPLRISTAGTHAIEGRPVSDRTRLALASLGLRADAHRSHQLTAADLESAALVLAMEGDHVRYVRRRHPEATDRTATLRRLCRDLPHPGGEPGTVAAGGRGDLAGRVAAMGLGALEPEPWEDVDDPAGREQEVFTACAEELDALVSVLVPRLC